MRGDLELCGYLRHDGRKGIRNYLVVLDNDCPEGSPSSRGNILSRELDGVGHKLIMHLHIISYSTLRRTVEILIGHIRFAGTEGMEGKLPPWLEAGRLG